MWILHIYFHIVLHMHVDNPNNPSCWAFISMLPIRSTKIFAAFIGSIITFDGCFTICDGYITNKSGLTIPNTTSDGYRKFTFYSH